MIALLFAVLWLALCASIAQDMEEWDEKTDKNWMDY